MKSILALGLLAAGSALAAANWILRPERAFAWAAALLLLGCFALMHFATRRRDSGASIRSAIGFAGVMMVISLGAKLAVTLGVIHDAEFSRRATNVVVGVLLAFMGNDIPKQLSPNCIGARAQALQRLAGWTWVLAGLAYAIAWFLLPPAVADPVTLALIVSAMLGTAAPLFWPGLRRA